MSVDPDSETREAQNSGKATVRSYREMVGMSVPKAQMWDGISGEL